MGFQSLVEMCNKAMIRHQQEFQEGHDRDFIDLYLKKMNDSNCDLATFQGEVCVMIVLVS